MKKLLVLLLALAMVFSMIACASKTEAPKDETPAETPKEETPAEAPASGDKEEVTLYV